MNSGIRWRSGTSELQIHVSFRAVQRIMGWVELVQNARIGFDCLSWDPQITRMNEAIRGERQIGDSQTYAIIGASMEVHRTLGRGFLEPVYQAALEVELDRAGIPFEREVELPVHYKALPLGLCYRADFVCYGDVLIELKALDRLTKREEAQVVHYLVASRLGRGILLNFGSSSLQVRRFVGPEFRLRSSSNESA